MGNKNKWALFWVFLFLVLVLSNLLNLLSVCYHLSIGTAGWFDFYKTLSLAQGLYITHNEANREMNAGHWLI